MIVNPPNSGIPALRRERPLMVTCPNCGKSGKLSSKITSGPHRIRCPRCDVRFDTQPSDTGEKDLRDPVVYPTGLSELAIDLRMEPELKSEEEATDIPDIDVGNLKIDDSDYELPAHREPRASIPPEPWFYGFLDGWGVFYLFGAVLTFVGLLLVIAFVVTGIITNVGGVPVLFLVVGAAVVAFFGSFLITCAAVIFLIVDQARNIRQLQLLAERAERA